MGERRRCYIDYPAAPLWKNTEHEHAGVFFSNKYANRPDLFEGLSIWEDKKYRKLQGTYPVIAISFADVKENTYEGARLSIIRTLQSVFNYFRDLWKHDNNISGSLFVSLSPSSPDADVAKSLQQFSDYLFEHYKRKVLIFMDEYDTPLQEAGEDGSIGMSAFPT